MCSRFVNNTFLSINRRELSDEEEHVRNMYNMAIDLEVNYEYNFFCN